MLQNNDPGSEREAHTGSVQFVDGALSARFTTDGMGEYVTQHVVGVHGREEEGYT